MAQFISYMHIHFCFLAISSFFNFRLLVGFNIEQMICLRNKAHYLCLVWWQGTLLLMQIADVSGYFTVLSLLWKLFLLFLIFWWRIVGKKLAIRIVSIILAMLHLAMFGWQVDKHWVELRILVLRCSVYVIERLNILLLII